MKKATSILGFLLFPIYLFAQVPGDTIVVKTFNYTQTYGTGIRDTMIHFPDQAGLTFEKIIMKYNMRCKGGVVSSGVTPQATAGCGEWDYSCNTYITDSTKNDSSKATHPSHIISGFSGTTYNYTTNPTYTYYQYLLQNVLYTSTINENTALVGTGNTTSNHPFNTALRNSKSLYLWKASELSNAGLSAGNISSIRCDAQVVGNNPNFLRIRIKHTTADSLNNESPDLTGFTEVYMNNPILNLGNNSFLFYQPFVWNGTDNIIVEFSYTNSNTGTNTVLSADQTNFTSALVQNEQDYAMTLVGNNYMQSSPNSFSGFNNEISICFWSYGNPSFLPQNTSVLYITNAQNHRQVNIHHPWSNENIYWDCGSGGSYDRINKLALANEYKGQWNHYAFTKNTSTGLMNIYINGVLWHSGTGKTIPVNLENLIVGANNNYVNNYYGHIDDLQVWDKELSQNDIATWMNKQIDASHPYYSNLKLNYTYNEGTGSLCNDALSSSNAGNIIGPAFWNITKGKDQFKGFENATIRPQITFVSGNYTQVITTNTVLDSVQNNYNTVRSFAVNGNTIVPVDTNYYYESGFSYIYDVNTNAKVDSIPIPTVNSINISTLNYYALSPSRYQIMSFVTPYGNGLNLGTAGKTWSFDVSDFEPVLKGWKRMTMDAGGQWQEDMDISFLFIVGTPPRTIQRFDNLWKVESTAYTNILNDTKFEPLTVSTFSNEKYFKIRSAITGHGQEGEFIPQTHWVNLNGGSNEFQWQVWKRCGENPVYPQGGTWIYDRAGWCPGMATDVQELDATPYINPGSPFTIDYGLNTAQGTSNYWVSNQLVTYSEANFTNDAAIVDILNPSSKVEYARVNPICSQPKVVIQNTGSATLTSLTIQYWVNNNSQKSQYIWTGNLAFMEKTEVVLPVDANLWAGLQGASGNIFHASISSSDQYTLNNNMQSAFEISEVVPSNFFVWFKTNNAASESSYTLEDENGNILFSRNSMTNNTNYKDTFQLGYGCYKLKVLDSDEDGISFWANNDGTGFLRLCNTSNGSTLKSFIGDFGTSLIYSFTIGNPLMSQQFNKDEDFVLYPNPASTSFYIDGFNIEKANINIYNILGQEIKVPLSKQQHLVHFSTQQLSKGIYTVVIKTLEGKNYTKKVSVE
ncbi:MAG: LamG-like jellyroll fold domain-containing protein [Chitinophagaceae bacterium]